MWHHLSTGSGPKNESKRTSPGHTHTRLYTVNTVSTRNHLSDRENASAGALIGTFVGDALGMPVEGWSHRHIQQEHGELDKMLDARRGRGTYTDDTQMMIATAKSLVGCEGVNARHMADLFLSHFDPVRGYGQGTTMVFQKWRNDVPVENASEQIFDGGSFGNGGSMRIAPVGVYYTDDPEQLADAVRTACGITHAHPLGIGGSYLQARSVAKAFNTTPDVDPEADAWLTQLQDDFPDDMDEDGVLLDKLEAAKRLLHEHSGPAPFSEVVDRLGCTSKAFESVPAAIYAFLANRDSFRDAVVYAVGIGGDTDTIGAMTGAIAGAYHGVTAVPDHWWNALENGSDGRDNIVELARKLV